MLKAFFRAVADGTIAAAALPVLIGFLFSLSAFIQPVDGGARSFAVFLMPIFTLGFVFAIVATGAIAVGIPATWLLSRAHMESERSYVILGALAASALIIAICVLEAAWSGLPVLAVFALPGGMVTGRSWYRYGRSNSG